MKKTRLFFAPGMLALLMLLAGCGIAEISPAKSNLSGIPATIRLDPSSAKALPGAYRQEDIKHLFLKAFEVDANGAYHVLPNLTADPYTILADGGNLTEFRKTGENTYSGMLNLNPANVGVHFVVWAVSYNDYTDVVAERNAASELQKAEAVAAGEESGYRTLYQVHIERNWTQMNAFNLTMIEGRFGIGDMGPAGGFILDVTEEFVDYADPAALDFVDRYTEIATRDCGLSMAWANTASAALSDHVNGFSDWTVPDGLTLELMMGVRTGMALYADSQRYWTMEEGDNPLTQGLALSVDYPSMGITRYETVPKTERLRLRAVRYTVSAAGCGSGFDYIAP